jgi:hypothetical protein
MSTEPGVEDWPICRVRISNPGVRAIIESVEVDYSQASEATTVVWKKGIPTLAAQLKRGEKVQEALPRVVNQGEWFAFDIAGSIGEGSEKGVQVPRRLRVYTVSGHAFSFEVPGAPRVEGGREPGS